MSCCKSTDHNPAPIPLDLYSPEIKSLCLPDTVHHLLQLQSEHVLPQIYRLQPSPPIHLTYTHLRSSPSACQILSITCYNCKVSMSCHKSTDHNPAPIHLTYTHLRSRPSACQILSITCKNCMVSMSCRKSTDYNPRPTSTRPILTWDQDPLPARYSTSLVKTARWVCLATNLQTTSPAPQTLDLYSPEIKSLCLPDTVHYL